MCIIGEVWNQRNFSAFTEGQVLQLLSFCNQGVGQSFVDVGQNLFFSQRRKAAEKG
jgi:hypothetical protein